MFDQESVYDQLPQEEGHRIHEFTPPTRNLREASQQDKGVRELEFPVIYFLESTIHKAVRTKEPREQQHRTSPLRG